jgi:hypothetical protein
MFRGLYRLLVAASDWRPRDVLVTVIGTELVVLLAVVSLGFGTFATYAHFAASEGTVYAALVISASYGVAAMLAGVTLRLWHARSARHRPSTPPVPEDLEALLQALAAGGIPQDPKALIAVLREGRDMSSMERLAASLIGGSLAGRNVGK